MEELWLSLAEIDPAQQFIFISGRSLGENTTLPANVSARKIKTSGIGWWDRQQLLRLIKELQAGIYVAVNQYSWNIKNAGAKNRGSRFFKQPGAKLFFSETHRLAAEAQQPSSPETYIIQPAAHHVVSDLSWTETESIKTQYSGGRDFFLFTGDIDEQHYLIELLKAFSVFKKWQQSNMQLVIGGHDTAWTDSFEEKLSTYKYRNDVVLLRDLSDEAAARLMAASYAVVYPSGGDRLPLPLINAAASGIAMIASDTAINREATPAASWIDNNNMEEGFAQAMINLYKDESQKQEIVRQIREKQTYTWEEMVKTIKEKYFAQG